LKIRPDVKTGAGTIGAIFSREELLELFEFKVVAVEILTTVAA
jgi:hypothetical protein